MQRKVIANQKPLTFGLRRHLHAHRPELSIYAAHPIDSVLRGKSSLEILQQSYSSVICFSTDNLTYDLVDRLRAFKPNDGYHATGLQFIADNLDLVVLSNAERISTNSGETTAMRLFENFRTAFVCLPAFPPWRLNSSHRFGLFFTPRLFRPAAGQFLTRLSQAREIPRFNDKYQEIRSRAIELIWLKYAGFLLDGGGLFSSTNTDYFIQLALREETHAACQKIAEYNNLLGLAEDNFELFPFKPDFSFNVRQFFAQSDWPRSVEPARP
jgi:hypothetical protein